MPRCIEIAPVKCSDTESAIRCAIKASTALPIPGQDDDDPCIMKKELAHLKRLKGWKNPQGLFGYTKDSGYKDIFAYFDYGDKKSPINELATKALSMYGLGGAQISGEPKWGPIRGNVVLLRIEPDYGFSPDAIYVPDISEDEIYQTLVFFRDSKTSAHKIALQRDSVRMMGGMGMPGARSGFGFVDGNFVMGNVGPEMFNDFNYLGPTGGTRTSKQVSKDSDKCDHCSKTQSLLGRKLKVCTCCNETFYCGKECQKAAWKKHKKARRRRVA